MTTRRRPVASSLRHPPLLRRIVVRPLSVALLVVLAASMTLQADAAPGDDQVIFVSAAEARERGLAIRLARESEDAAPPVVVVAVEERAGGAVPPADPRALLDVAPGGRIAAVATRVGPDPTDIVLARADGAQLVIPVPGVLAASFTPDGRDLAVIDGLGRLEVLSTADGATRIVADGPFLGPLTAEADGSVMLLAVSSVEAPFEARLGRIDLDRGGFELLDDGELVYSGTRLADGSLAVVAHTPSGSVVRRRDNGATEVLATLEPGAIHVAVGADGDEIAWERAGEIFVRRRGGGVRSLGGGLRPRFAPGGGALLVDDGGEATLILTETGRRIGLGSATASFDRCGPGCAP